MKKKVLLTLMMIALSILALGAVGVSAATYGDLTYTISNGEATITDCSESASGELVIPDTLGGYPVTTIGNDAFYYCRRLTSITIPDSVTTIGDDAFSDCYRLTSITIPDSVTTIGDSAFSDCDGLTSITIPDSVTAIGDDAFYNCTGLTSITIPDSVTTIGDWAFYYCDGLTSITIPDSVTTIGSGAFYYCDGLTSVTIGGSVTTIGGSAFYSCDGLTSITIPDSVTTIGNDAFSGCDGLTSVNIGGSVTTISDRAFYNCRSLTSVTIGDSVTAIGEYAFYYCDGLTSITIPDSVTIIGDWAFVGCDGLTSIAIPDSVTTIGDRAFYYCTGLTNVYYNGTEEEWNKIEIGYNNESLTNATKTYFYYVTYIDESGAVIQNDMVTPNTTTILPNISVAEGYEVKFYADEAYTTEFNATTPITENTTVYVRSLKKQVELYRINSITIKDMSGNSLEAIPTGAFLATVSFTNVSSSADAVIALAEYSDAGAFKDLMYIQIGDVPTGSTIKLSIPVDNTEGDVAKLKAFCWESFSSLVPLGNSASFPTE